MTFRSTFHDGGIRIYTACEIDMLIFSIMNGLLFPFRIIFVIALGVFVTTPAKTIYVSLEGNDSTAQPDDPTRPFQSLTNAFQTLRNGDRLEIGAGQYTITPGDSYYALPDRAPMKLQNLTNVTVVGNGEVEIYGEGPGDFLMIADCKNVRIENLTFKGNRPPAVVTPFQLTSMVLLRGVNDQLWFERCSLIGFGNHGISHLYDAKTSFNLVVTNCYFADGGSIDVGFLFIDGAAVSGIGSGSRIVNNVVERCFRGFEVEGAYEGQITNVVIEANLITNCYQVGIMLFATDHRELGRPDTYFDIRVMNNRISNVLPLPGRDPYFTWGIFMTGGQNLLISDNHIQNVAWGTGIEASSTHMRIKNVTVVSNVIENARARGIQLYQTKPFEDGLVMRNTLRSIGDEGILLYGTNFQCRENVVEDTAWADDLRGAITSYAVEAIIADNIIRNTSANFADYGIWLRGSTNTTIYGNTFALLKHAAIRDDGTNSRILPKVHSLGKANSSVNLAVSGLPGTSYRLDITYGFDIWTTVTNKTCPDTGLFDFEYVADPARGLARQTFFRVVSN